jgi:hypothetical protein
MEGVSMDKKIMVVAAIAFWCIGCVAGTPQGDSDVRRAPFSTLAASGPDAAGTGDPVFDPGAIDETALPDLRDLPMPAALKKQPAARRYTGIIKNNTRYEVYVPSENSEASLAIPAHGWIEYTAWTQRFNVSVYREGKPFYCLKIMVQPQDYPFMCNKYDFMAEIVKPEPAPVEKPKPVKKKRRLKRTPKSEEGVEGLG